MWWGFIQHAEKVGSQYNLYSRPLCHTTLSQEWRGSSRSLTLMQGLKKSNVHNRWQFPQRTFWHGSVDSFVLSTRSCHIVYFLLSTLTVGSILPDKVSVETLVYDDFSVVHPHKLQTEGADFRFVTEFVLKSGSVFSKRLHFNGAFDCGMITFNATNKHSPCNCNKHPMQACS